MKNSIVSRPLHRYLVAEDGHFLGGDRPDQGKGEIMILVDQGDETYRKTTGKSLREIDYRFPGFIGDMNLTRLVDDS